MVNRLTSAQDTPKLDMFALALQSAAQDIGRSMAVVGQGLKSNAKAQLKQAIVQRPLNALMGNLIEPLEPLTDIVGGVGSIIGAGLTPIMTEFYKFLIPILPAIQKGMEALKPAIDAISWGIGDSIGKGMDPTLWAMQELTDAVTKATEASRRQTEATKELRRTPGGITSEEFMATTDIRQLIAQKEAQNV